MGHRLTGSGVIGLDTNDLHQAEHLAEHAARRLRATLRNLDELTITPAAQTWT